MRDVSQPIFAGRARAGRGMRQVRLPPFQLLSDVTSSRLLAFQYHTLTDPSTSIMTKSSTGHLKLGHENDIVGITVADDTGWALASLAQRIATHRQSLSDMRISCRGVYFRTHSLVLAAHSKVLEQLCESAAGEHGPLELRLDTEPLIAVKAMVDYFYSLRYALPKIPLDYATLIPDDFLPHSPIIHALVFQLATKLDLSHLGDLAVMQFVADMDVCTIGLLYSREVTCGAAKIRPFNFAEVAKYVYEESSPHFSRLRHALVRSILVPAPHDHGFEDFWCWWIDCTRCEADWSPRDFDDILKIVPALASDLLTTITGQSDHRETCIRLDDLRIALTCGTTPVEQLRIMDDPPPDVYLEDDAEDWRSESADEEVVAAMDDPIYDVRASVLSCSDLPPDLYLSDYAVDCEMEDIAAEVMDMVYSAEYDVRAEARGSGDPPTDLYLKEHAMECEMDDIAVEVRDMIHGHWGGYTSGECVQGRSTHEDQQTM